LKYKNSVLLTSIVHTLLFIPFYLSGFIGADWDSYALIGSAKIFIEQGIYIPSRPPGFPLSELLTLSVINVSEVFNIHFEKVLLVIQYLFLLLSNILLSKLFKINNQKINFYYLIVMFSPIYIISGFTVIDYMAGLVFGYMGVYIFNKHKSANSIVLISFLFSISIGFRLSNIIFLISLVIYIIFIKKEAVLAFKIIFLTSLLSSIIYGVAYWSLWSTSLKTIYGSNLSELVCIFNLTNTDHTLLSRLGRFVIKQTNYLSVLGSILFIINIPKLKFIKLSENIVFFLIFIFFQLSFVRLPTEEGHMLPAFIALFLIISNSNIDFSFKKLILILTFISNFLNLNFYVVDEVDSANSILFTSDIRSGLLIEDYEIRAEKGKNKLYHYQNSVDTLNIAWKNGCPN
tara:strand:+ start:4311 stop:5516 length:1206 start_codon:yes stop_codon:yes gene_type:complete